MALHVRLKPWTGWLCALGLCLTATGVQAQPAATRTALKPGEPSLFKLPEFRKVVPGVERPINPERSFRELTEQQDIPEILDIDANYDWAKTIEFRHDIWAFDFTFKPVRMVEVDVPAPGGKLQKKLVWYLIYRIKNPGVIWHVEPTKYADPDKKVTPKAGVEFDFDVAGQDALIDGKVEVLEDRRDAALRFMPTFLLFSRDAEIGKQYLDRIIPASLQPIAQREDPIRFAKTPLRNTVDMSGEIPASTPEEDKSVWGVATWQDVDPRTDFFSIYIQGLTNAHVRKYVPGKGWWYAQKTLRLDFRRPGDEFLEDESEIRYLKASWVYLDAKWSTSPDDADSAAPKPIAAP